MALHDEEVTETHQVDRQHRSAPIPKPSHTLNLRLE